MCHTPQYLVCVTHCCVPAAPAASVYVDKKRQENKDADTHTASRDHRDEIDPRNTHTHKQTTYRHTHTRTHTHTHTETRTRDLKDEIGLRPQGTLGSHSRRSGLKILTHLSRLAHAHIEIAILQDNGRGMEAQRVLTMYAHQLAPKRGRRPRDAML